MHADEQEILCSMALSRVLHLNSLHQQLLLREAGSATELYRQRKNLKDLLPQASPRIAEALRDMDTQMERAREELDFARKNRIQCICYSDERYPQRLRECADAPVLLYYRGSRDLNAQRVVSIIGTRRCTEYGKELCRHLTAELQRLCPDVVVVSGLAYGIDIQAHRHALACGLDTVGVLAHGLDQIYPRTHRDTAAEMTSHGGLLTEFMSRTNADKVNFIRRNRIVAGMADATVVVESAAKGGALITAELAEGYHRDVFAFPGRTTDPYSQGCLALIRANRAVLVTGAEDIVNAMGWATRQTLEEARRQPVQRDLFPDLTDEERLVADCLAQCDDKQINMLAVETNIPIHKVSALLFGMEMKGVVKMLSGGRYRLLR